MIPRYCPDTQGWSERSGTPSAPSAAAKRWLAMMGPGFWAVHHYCWGQINLQRALRTGTPPQIRRGLLEGVIGDYYYVVNNTKSDFILLPEIYTRIGEAQLHLSRPNEASKAFAQARALKPDYWPAYSHWAEFLMKSGKTAEAKQVVKAGLEYSPNSKVLAEQYRLLGGKRSDIVPKVKEAAPASDTGETNKPRATPYKESTDAPPTGSADQ
ncbi:MAG: tetratricopeptide repeat protein [Candidatus Accumulibacter necessarius]|uniref:tetratricopeptide repeat protein n=1 Tax=Candidatus Accumulibacter necessarius TaxID=2954386 RepID=UPI002FC38508